MRHIALLALAALPACVGACSHAAQRPPEDRTMSTAASPDATLDADAQEDSALLDASLDAADEADALLATDDPMAIHHEARAELIALVDVRPLTEAEFKLVRPDIFLSLNVGPAVTRMNQGNKAIAHHAR